MSDLRDLLKKYYPIILLVIVVALSVDLLSFSSVLTGPILAKREREAIITKLGETFPNMTDSVIIDNVYVVITANDEILSYAFVAQGYGIGGVIKTLIILENENTVKEITVIRQTETPDLGDKITLPDFTTQFAMRKIDEIKLRSEAGQIDAITGATVSSVAVVEMVRNTTLEQLEALPSTDEVNTALLEKREKEAEEAGE
ncbi:FMN-binding protein [Chloroflexota bacterium]